MRVDNGATRDVARTYREALRRQRRDDEGLKLISATSTGSKGSNRGR